jgi:hypothetical protein
MVARRQELAEDELAPYWAYKSALLENTRASHAALHNRVYHRDDPFWNTWYPPNAWNCKCDVISLTERQAKSGGYKLDHPYAPNNDKDWGYNVGATDPLVSVTDGAYSRAIKALRNTQQGEWGQDWARSHVAKVLEAARESVDDKAYREWAKLFYDDKGERIGSKSPVETIAVGAMGIREFDYFAKKGKVPLSAIIVITKEKFGHGTRKEKTIREAALSMEQMLRIPYYLKNPKAVLWDKEFENILYVFDVAGSKNAKMIVKVNYVLVENRTKIASRRNTLVSSGIVEKHNLKEPRYELIYGSLD